MQEEKEPKKPSFIQKAGLMNIVCVLLFAGALLLSAAAVAYSYRHLPTHKHGEHGKNFPWAASGITIAHAECGWMDVSADKWMMMNGIPRTPFIKLQLGDFTGAGTLYVQFKNSEGQSVGQPVTLLYRDGQFNPIDRRYFKAEGKEALVYGYPVFRNTHFMSAENQYLEHFIDERSKHWQAEVSFIPADRETTMNEQRYRIGYTTIPKKLFTPEQ